MLLAAMLAALSLAVATPVGALTLFDVDSLDELEILAVQDGEPAQVLLSAPARLTNQTLTADDVVAEVDGRQQPIRLQRLTVDDLELAIVLDTTLPIEDLRAMQGAVVELALDLPQGATLRIIDAAGRASAPAAVSGPAIAQIRELRAGGDGDIAQAVDAARRLLEDSEQSRTALLVVGRDLDQRLRPVDDMPPARLTYIVNVGEGSGTGLLGPTAGGTVITVEAMDQVLAATGQMSEDLRNLYRAEVTVPDPEAQTLTLRIPSAGDDASSRTVALDPNSVRPVEVDPVTAGDRPAADGPALPDVSLPEISLPEISMPDISLPEVSLPDMSLPEVTVPGRSFWLPLAAAVAAVAVLALLILAGLLLRRRMARSGDDVDPPAPEVPADATATPMRRIRATPSGETRPIAKLTAGTREALAHAHLGLRRLALASRETADTVPDEMFRLVEARASAALSGHDVEWSDVLWASLANRDAGPDVELIQRAANALATGWQHTARRRSAPPPVLEINAVLTGGKSNGDKGPKRPVAPVRALNPLVEIGLEHVVLAARAGRHAGMVARAVTAVDIMRAARLARPVLTMSPYLLEHPQRYEGARRADLTDGYERDQWLELLCESVARGASTCADQLARLGALRARYRQRADDSRLLPLIDLLLARPILDADLVQQRMSVSREAALSLLPAAVEAGWLQPDPHVDGVWLADGVLSLFAHPADAHEWSSQPA